MSIESQIKQLIDSFSSAGSGLFEITGRYQSVYEQGIYGCAIAKPTKRMKQALGVDRELLVVVSTFSDQQQRTIKFIKKEIDDSNGRYESAIAIVIHKDLDGNQKLKNWGRDLGISILPIQGTSQLTSSNTLEHVLAFELYSHDPFDVTGPVSDDANFYGRRDEAIDLARKLQRGQIRSCLGIRKVGKTSIINRILREIRGNYKCTSLMIDCSRDDVWEMSASQLLNSLGKTIEAALSSTDGYASIVPVTAQVDIKAARDSLENSILQSENPIVFIFDEIDYITPGSPTRPEWRKEFNSFWRNLRSIYQESERQHHKMSILIGGVSTYWFTLESVEGVENAALSFIPEEYLSPMPEGATVAMLKRLGKIAGLTFEDSVAYLIAKATGNMPYWARKCCSYIHRNIPVSDRPCTINLDRASPLVEAFVSEEGAAIAEVALGHLFRVHPQLLEATRKCQAGDAENVSEPLRRALRRYGVLSSKDQLSGEMLNRAFSTLISDAVDINTPATGSNESQRILNLSIGEWAEEVAALGKRRNLLERRIRDLALNFLRFDALSKNNPAEVKERILAILPEPSRSAFRHLPAQECVTKFLWTDLVKLVIKEWVLFEKVFGDRELFKKDCDIINDRFDAHAKDADQADLALYRRALKHIEDRMAKLL